MIPAVGARKSSPRSSVAAAVSKATQKVGRGGRDRRGFTPIAMEKTRTELLGIVLNVTSKQGKLRLTGFSAFDYLAIMIEC
jgi:hypothetical protein